jgi:hypothetical protein
MPRLLLALSSKEETNNDDNNNNNPTDVQRLTGSLHIRDVMSWHPRAPCVSSGSASRLIIWNERYPHYEVLPEQPKETNEARFFELRVAQGSPLAWAERDHIDI